MSRSKRVVRSAVKSEEKKSTLWIWAVIAGLGVVGLGALLVISLLPQAEATIDGLLQFPNLSRGHNDAVSYSDSLPPAGGEHASIWQNCGIYDTPVEGKYAIHSLEHGAVWITYQPDLSAADIEALQAMVRGQSFILLSPWPGLPDPVVLTAWGVQLSVPGVDDERIGEFINEFRLGRQTPEPGASCTGGVGSPTG